MAENEHPVPKEPRSSLLNNYISFAGMAIAAAGLTSFALLVLIEFSGTAADNPYTALVTYILVPGVLLLGLLVVFVGVMLERRRRRLDPHSSTPKFPVLDLNEPRRRRSFVVFIVLAFMFLFLSAFGSYHAFEYTESVVFCGQACHSVMKPEFVAYQASPHAKVACVECHVGSGADGYARSKINGMRQLYGVATGHYNRPVNTPVHNMPAAAQTCQKCHWSEKYNGDQIRVFDHYAYDEQNSLNRTRLLVKVGGGSAAAGPVGGIHWHMSVANEITYVATDEKRQNIPWVQMKDANGQVTEYAVKNGPLLPQQLAAAEKRRMDCIDCHNRPAHIFLSPNDAVDQSLAAGKLDISLPYIKATAVEYLNKPYATEDEAMATIASGIDEYYRTTYPAVYGAKRDSINYAAAEVQRLFRTYFFPEMKTNWATHVNNIGHRVFQGCFRCHDGRHVSPDGRTIRNECNICHTTIDQTIAGKTTVPPEGKFQHPLNLGDRGDWLCASCHRGDRPFKHPINLGDISRFQCVECHSGIYEKVKYQ